MLMASGELSPDQIQDLGDIMPKLLDIKAKTNIPIKFRVKIELGDGKARPSEEIAQEINKLLADLKEDFRLR